MTSTGKRWFSRAALLALGIAAVIVARRTVWRPEPVPVTIHRVALGRVEDTVTNSRAGSVRTRHLSALSPESGGRVAELAVRAGDRVSAGQVLLRLDDSGLRAEQRLRERSVEAARAVARETCLAAAQAGRDLERARSLAKDGIAPAETVEQVATGEERARAGCAAGAARVREASAALDLVAVALDKTALRAPFAGVVTEVAAAVGEWISPSPPGLPLPAVIALLDPDAIYVSAPIDEVDAGKVQPGSRVRVTLDAFAGRTLEGRVSRVAPYVKDDLEQNRTLEIEVELVDRDPTLRLLPGTSADVEVILAARDGVVRVPSHALAEGKQVLLVDGETLVARTVETGLKNWQFTEVVKGLTVGDAVVVSLDRAEVRTGARVRIAGESER